MRINQILNDIYIEKTVGGGYGLATDPDSKKKIFIISALPGEIIDVKITHITSKYARGTVVKIKTPSEHRIEPRDNGYLANSVWQICDFEYENTLKQVLVKDAYDLHKLDIPTPKIVTDGRDFFYRNKFNYSFSDESFDFALIEHASHRHLPVKSNSLPNKYIENFAEEILNIITDYAGSSQVGNGASHEKCSTAAGNGSRKNTEYAPLRYEHLKNLLIRANADGEVLAVLYITTESIDIDLFKKRVEEFKKTNNKLKYFELRLFDNFKGKPDKILFSLGKNELKDDIFGVDFYYCISSFFQVNQPVYKSALKEIINACAESYRQNENSSKFNITDMFCGIGTIGLSVLNAIMKENAKRDKNDRDPARIPATYLIESDKNSYKFLKKNCENFYNLFSANSDAGNDKNRSDSRRRNNKIHPVLSKAERAYEYINENSLLILNPPRAGVDKKLVSEILSRKPMRIVYLSCNPVTQARDVKALSEAYKLENNIGFNFFPRTTHIEHLVVLSRV